MNWRRGREEVKNHCATQLKSNNRAVKALVFERKLDQISRLTIVDDFGKFKDFAKNLQN